MGDFSHLWNDLPIEERKRLCPFTTQSQILHLEQARAIAVRHHDRFLFEINNWIANLKETLPSTTKDGENK